MRKIIVILLLGCLFVYMGGYWLLGQYQQYTIKREMKAKLKANLSSKETQQFVFLLRNDNPTDESFYWENEDEFHYQDKMYDVISKKVIGNKLFITCINDDKEEELINYYVNLAKKENNKPGNTSLSVQLMLSLVFISADNNLTADLPVKINLTTAVYQFRLLNRSSEILIPPPQA